MKRVVGAVLLLLVWARASPQRTPLPRAADGIAVLSPTQAFAFLPWSEDTWSGLETQFSAVLRVPAGGPLFAECSGPSCGCLSVGLRRAGAHELPAPRVGPLLPGEDWEIVVRSTLARTPETAMIGVTLFASPEARGHDRFRELVLARPDPAWPAELPRSFILEGSPDGAFVGHWRPLADVYATPRVRAEPGWRLAGIQECAAPASTDVLVTMLAVPEITDSAWDEDTARGSGIVGNLEFGGRWQASAIAMGQRVLRRTRVGRWDDQWQNEGAVSLAVRGSGRAALLVPPHTRLTRHLPPQ